MFMCVCESMRAGLLHLGRRSELHVMCMSCFLHVPIVAIGCL